MIDFYAFSDELRKIAGFGDKLIAEGLELASKKAPKKMLHPRGSIASMKVQGAPKMTHPKVTTKPGEAHDYGRWSFPRFER